MTVNTPIKSSPTRATLMQTKLMLSVLAVATIGFSPAADAQIYHQNVVQPASSIGQSYPASGQVYQGQVYQIPHTPNQPQQTQFGGTYSINGVQPANSIHSTNVRIPWTQELLSSVTTKHDFGAVPALSLIHI